jgi:signal recognition particle subunit SRP19
MGKKGGGRVRVKQVGPKGASMNPLQDLMVAPEEMITLPPKMDSSITHFWPLSQTFSMNYKTFPCIWPTYIDASKTMKEGRRIKKEVSVENPTVQDISEVLQSMNVRHAIQPYKGYPRDVESRWFNTGRILFDIEQMEERVGGVVSINDPSDAIDVDDVPELNDDVAMTQKQCWKMIASKVESMPGRIARKVEKKKALEDEARKERAKKATAAKNSKASKSTGGGSNKKKGKKRR